MTMTIWAILCFVLFMITFFSTKERIQPVSHEKSSVKQDFSDLIKNNPWKIMFGMTMVHFAILAGRGAALYNVLPSLRRPGRDVRLAGKGGPHRSSAPSRSADNRNLGSLARLHRPRHES